MAAPTAYTESTLKQFIVDELAGTGVALGLTTVSNQVTQAVYAVERLVGVDDVADATDVALLEAAARWQAWVVAEAAAINGVDLKSDGDEIKFSQRLAGIRVRLAQVRSDWYTALAASAATTGGSGIPFVFATIRGRRGR